MLTDGSTPSAGRDPDGTAGRSENDIRFNNIRHNVLFYHVFFAYILSAQYLMGISQRFGTSTLVLAALSAPRFGVNFA